MAFISSISFSSPPLISNDWGLWHPAQQCEHPAKYMDVRSPGPSTDVPGTMSRILRVADDVMAYLWTTRSDNSASFAEFQRSVVPTRYPVIL